jgi:hypothetical protein
VGEKKYSSRTRLDSDRVRMPPTGKKSSTYPYPSDQVPGRYRVSVPKLPSLEEGGGMHTEEPRVWVEAEKGRVYINQGDERLMTVGWG